MKIKIVKCSDPNWWYKYSIGDEYYVRESRTGNYVITVGPEAFLKEIDVNDCEIL